MQIIINDLITNYEQIGKGKVVLLLHGWGDDKTTFNALKTELLKTYEVVSLDFPGFGKTELPKEAWGLDDFANFVAEFIKKVNLKPYAIIGHSNGGAIAIRGLATKVLTTDKLVLIASSGIRNQYSPKNKIIRLAAKGAKLPVGLMPTSWQKSIKKKVYKAIGSDLFVAEHMQQTFRKIIEDDVQKDAALLGLPTLLIYGDKDSATPQEYGQMLHGLIGGSVLQIIPGAEHFVHHEEPAKVNEIVEEFLS